MPIVIKQARTSKQLVEILQHRHRCHHQSEGKLVDHMDILPSTLNIVAYIGSRVTGSARAVQFDKTGESSHIPYNFSESCDKLNGLIGYIDMVCLSTSEYLFSNIYSYLLKMCIYQLAQKGYKHVIYAAPEEMTKEVLALGFTALNETKNGITPCILRIEDFILKFEQVFADKEILSFRETFYYTIFEAGEIMVVEGERGNTAYVSEKGEVEVIIKSESGLVSISQIPTGQLIGEIAMITNEPRTASLICKDTTACVSFDRGEFLQILYSEPHRSIQIFKIFSRRLSASNRIIAELRKG
jgi:CRP/FNR family cyclic AMP-dependent transcriptional regulator